MRFKAALIHFTVILAAFAVNPAHAAARALQMVGFGDSLMAGYQLAPGDAYPARLEAALKAEGVDVTIANAGVSGDTTSAGLARIDWSVPDGTDAVILELGANDALRGVPPQETERNLDAMLTRLKERGIAVILMGMLAPPNMGAEFGEKFNGLFPRLAQKHGVALYPFFLDGVAAQSALQLEDGMHPNPEGVNVMVEKSLPAIREFVKGISTGTK